MATEKLYFADNISLNIEKNVDDIERHKSRYRFASKQLTDDQVVLDCACGSGYGSDILKDHCKKVIGVDIDSKAIDFANSKYKADNLSYLCRDIGKLSNNLEKVNTVVCLNTLQHVADPRILLDGIMKVLKNEGQLIISAPVREASRENPTNEFHVLEFTHDDLKSVLDHYFQQVEICLQDQGKFVRIDENINWGDAVATCKYPKNMTIENIDLIIRDREIKKMDSPTLTSYISEKALISKRVSFKPSFEDGIYHIADNVEIRDNTIIESHAKGLLEVGPNSVIGYGCWLNSTGTIKIGENTLIGANTIITSSSHHVRSTAPILKQAMSFAPVSIGSNVWIGSNVSILKGVTIGDNAVIGANCVIKRNVSPNTVIKAHDGFVEEIKKINKVAFYLLPFAIRESGLTFECIYERYKILASSFTEHDWDVVFIATDDLSEKISQDGWKVHSPSQYNVEYDDSIWFERWKRVLNSETDELHSYFISQVLKNESPEMVFCWNFDGLLKQECNKQRINVYFNELGVSRKPNPLIYYSDPEGVNSQSAFLSFWDEFSNFELSEHEKTVSRLTLGNVRSNYPTIDADKKRTMLESLGLSGASKVVLIALQVEDDSNIVAGSNYQSMQEFVSDCTRLADKSVKFIIKKHPGQLDCRIDSDDRLAIVNDEFATEELIVLSDSVFTINSSLGFEAFIAGKSVYTFGISPYSAKGLFHCVENGDINSIFEVSNAYYVDNEKLLKYVYMTYHQYFLSEQEFFDAEFHIRRNLLRKNTSQNSKAYFFNSGSYFKERELEVNRFQNKVLQNSILGYEKWIEDLKETEKSVLEVSDWAQSLNNELTLARAEIERRKLFSEKYSIKLIVKKVMKKFGI